MREIKYSPYEDDERYKKGKVKGVLLILLPIIVPIITFVICVVITYILFLPIDSTKIEIVESELPKNKTKITMSNGTTNNIPVNVSAVLYDQFGNVFIRPIVSVPREEVHVDIYDVDMNLMCNRKISETDMDMIITKLIEHNGISNPEASIYNNSGYAFILASQKTGLDPIFLLVLSEIQYYSLNTTADYIQKIDINTPYEYTPNQKFCVLVDKLSNEFFEKYYLPGTARTLFEVGLISDYVTKVPSTRYLMGLDMQFCYDILNNGGTYYEN